MTFGGEHTIEYTDIELQCSTPEIHIMLLINVTWIKNLKRIFLEIPLFSLHLYPGIPEMKNCVDYNETSHLKTKDKGLIHQTVVGLVLIRRGSSPTTLRYLDKTGRSNTFEKQFKVHTWKMN